MNYEERKKEWLSIITDNPGTTRRECKMPTYFKNEKLAKTQRYINEVKEDIKSFRRRKILWAIGDMKTKSIYITPYKVQYHAGFGELKDKVIRKLIEELIKEDYDNTNTINLDYKD